ncbi:hypothetical protein WJX84_007850 [Apatococcus fuscideae]|uniref:Probable RuBisCO transcriptional regulator n=1 Tax=Apatococcus fuscideae TaxID=2026836 RepID=A0AAW1TDV4_9CHLO
MLLPTRPAYSRGECLSALSQHHLLRTTPAPSQLVSTAHFLLYPLAVACADCIDAAAEQLGLSKRSVHGQLAKLEEMVGLQLLKKGPNKSGSVELTGSGELLLRFCGAIHSLAADLQTAAAESHATYPGRITVSTTDFLGKCTILQLLERIAQQMPDVSLTLKVDTGQACCEAVRDSSCDLALTQGISPQSFSDLQVLPCNQQEIVLVVKPNHPLDSQEPVNIQTLRTIPFISLRSSYAAMAIQPLLQDTLSWDALHSRMELESVEATVRAVELGLGAAFLPRIAVQRELDRGNLAAVPLDFPNPLSSHISAVLNPAKYRPRAVQLLLHNLCPAAFPEPVNASNGSETTTTPAASAQQNGSSPSKEVSQDDTAHSGAEAAAAAASLGAASGAAKGTSSKLGMIAGAIAGAASGAAASTAAVMSAGNGLPGDLFFSSTKHSNGKKPPGPAHGSDAGAPQQSQPHTNGANGHRLLGRSGPESRSHYEQRSMAHATAGVYNSLDGEHRSAAIEGQTGEHMRAEAGMREFRDLGQTAWPGLSEVLAVQSSETEVQPQPQPQPQRAGCFIPDWTFSQAPSNGSSEDSGSEEGGSSGTENSRFRIPFTLMQLAVFQTVARTGSLTGAANTLSISQPAVSKSLSHLEQGLGCVLLARSGARAGGGSKGRQQQGWLTGEGQALLPFCERLLGAAGEARKALAVQAAGQTGVISLGASQTIGTYVLPRLIAAFRHRHPQVTVSVQVEASRKLCSRVAKGEVDAALIGGEVPIEIRHVLRTDVFAEDELVLIVPRGHRLAGRGLVDKEELYSLRFLSMNTGSSVMKNQEAMLRQQGVSWGRCTVDMELNSVEAIKTAVQCGLGAAFVSACAIQKELDLGLVARVDIAGVRLARGVLLVSNPHRAQPHATLQVVCGDFCSHLAFVALES